MHPTLKKNLAFIVSAIVHLILFYFIYFTVASSLDVPYSFVSLSSIHTVSPSSFIIDILLFATFIGSCIYINKSFSFETSLYEKEQEVSNTGKKLMETSNMLKEHIELFKSELAKRKSVESELERSNDKLKDINRDLEKFSYIIVNDLHAPLRSIKNLSSWIEEDLKLHIQGVAKKNFDNLKGRISRLENLIEGLVLYSSAGKQVYEAQKLDLNILIKEMVTELKLDSKFEVQIPQLLPVLTTPREVLTQVYSNLFNNVMKFNNSAKINLEITYVKNNERVIFCVADVTSSSQSDVTMLTASDTNEVQDALFEGTGAGLSIAKKLVELYNGKVWVESEIGKGIKFYFSWPNM